MIHVHDHTAGLVSFDAKGNKLLLLMLDIWNADKSLMDYLALFQSPLRYRPWEQAE
ncbi:hypothetical protein C2W64_03100 [Brevibacillus laterosporus]|nr:hypothetical protein C2W64_03100 [Brevibacillus laterosporus]